MISLRCYRNYIMKLSFLRHILIAKIDEHE